MTRSDDNPCEPRSIDITLKGVSWSDGKPQDKADDGFWNAANHLPQMANALQSIRGILERELERLEHLQAAL